MVNSLGCNDNGINIGFEEFIVIAELNKVWVFKNLGKLLVTRFENSGIMVTNRNKLCVCETFKASCNGSSSAEAYDAVFNNFFAHGISPFMEFDLLYNINSGLSP